MSTNARPDARPRACPGPGVFDPRQGTRREFLLHAGNGFGMVALSFLLGLGLGCAQPMVMSALYAASPPGRQGEVVGMRTTMINASSSFMPLFFGALGTALGIGPILWAMAVILVSGSALAARKRNQKS